MFILRRCSRLKKSGRFANKWSEYQMRVAKTARARDFYDVHVIIEGSKIDLADQENLELVRQIFAAKEVPLELMELIEKYREFHRQDWPSVEATVGQELKSIRLPFRLHAGCRKEARIPLEKIASTWDHIHDL